MGAYQITVMLITIFLLITHTFQLFNIVVDAYTFLFIFVLLAIPLLPQIQRLKFWNFELERILNENEKRVEVLTPLKQSEKNFSKKDLDKVSTEIEQLLLEDHILALAKLRMELEKAIRRAYLSFAKFQGKESQFISIGQMVNELERNIPKLDKNLLASVKDVTAVCNRAIHGGEVNTEQARRIVNLGLTVIALFGGLNEAFEDISSAKN